MLEIKRYAWFMAINANHSGLEISWNWPDELEGQQVVLHGPYRSICVNAHQVSTVCDVLEFLSNKCHIMPLYIFLQNSRVNAAIYFKVFNIEVRIKGMAIHVSADHVTSNKWLHSSLYLLPLNYFTWGFVERETD